MRVENWNPNAADADFSKVVMTRLVEAAKVVESHVKSHTPVGTVTRPIYKTGPYRGQPWTARDGGALKKSVRIVRKKTKAGNLSRKKNVRVYAGNYFAYYASIVEHESPFMRPAMASALPEVRSIIGVK